MGKIFSDRLKHMATGPLRFLVIELAIVALLVVLSWLGAAVMDQIGGGWNDGSPLWLVLWPIMLSLVSVVPALTIGLNLWALSAVIGALKPQSGPRQWLKGRLPAVALLGLAMCATLSTRFIFPDLFALQFEFALGLALQIVGLVFIVSTALAWAYLLIAAPRLTAGILLRGLGLSILMILLLWLPLRVATGQPVLSWPMSPERLTRQYDAGGRGFSGANLRGADLSGANLVNADLSGANLSDADLSGANLRSADLGEADLSGADLTEATLTRANLSDANLSGTRLRGAQVDGVFAYEIDLRQADLAGANLEWADLHRAELGGANLSEADLQGAWLTGADLSGADLRQAKVTAEQLALAHGLQGATMPDGSVHE